MYVFGFEKSNKQIFQKLLLPLELFFYTWPQQLLLKLWHAFKSPGDLGKMQILIQWLWGETQDSARLISSQMRPMLLVYGLHFKCKCYTTLLSQVTKACSMATFSRTHSSLFVFTASEPDQPKLPSKPGATAPYLQKDAGLPSANQ